MHESLIDDVISVSVVFSCIWILTAVPRLWIRAPCIGAVVLAVLAVVAVLGVVALLDVILALLGVVAVAPCEPAPSLLPESQRRLLQVL